MRSWTDTILPVLFAHNEIQARFEKAHSAKAFIRIEWIDEIQCGYVKKKKIGRNVKRQTLDCN